VNGNTKPDIPALEMIKGFLNLPWFLWAALALMVAVIYSFVWPHKAVIMDSGFRFFILRWGHALTWLLLALNFALRGLSPSFQSAANWVSLAGGAMYLLFILATFVVR
jgi:hypothetical protein